MARDRGECERTWRVRSLPDPLPAGTTICQGDVAVGREVAVCIRRAGHRRIATVQGPGTRGTTELAWEITPEQFDALWPLTAGRRLEMVRHEVPVGGHTAVVDVFGGALAGLVVVRLAFDDAIGAGAFTPPGWFGDDVTHDPRYAEATLACDGLPARG